MSTQNIITDTILRFSKIEIKTGAAKLYGRNSAEYFKSNWGFFR